MASRELLVGALYIRKRSRLLRNRNATEFETRFAQ